MHAPIALFHCMVQVHTSMQVLTLARQALGGAARGRLAQPRSTPSGTFLTSWHVAQYLCLTSLDPGDLGFQ